MVSFKIYINIEIYALRISRTSLNPYMDGALKNYFLALRWFLNDDTKELYSEELLGKMEKFDKGKEKDFGDLYY